MQSHDRGSAQHTMSSHCLRLVTLKGLKKSASLLAASVQFQAHLLLLCFFFIPALSGISYFSSKCIILDIVSGNPCNASLPVIIIGYCDQAYGSGVLVNTVKLLLFEFIWAWLFWVHRIFLFERLHFLILSGLIFLIKLVAQTKDSQKY